MEEIDITGDILNYQYYGDKRYCEFDDWLGRVRQKYHCSEVDYNSASNIAKILMRQYLQPANKIALMPLNLHSHRVKRIPLEFKVFSKDAGQSRLEALMK